MPPRVGEYIVRAAPSNAGGESSMKHTTSELGLFTPAADAWRPLVILLVLDENRTVSMGRLMGVLLPERSLACVRVAGSERTGCWWCLQ
jgi:hypothetical protein